MLNQIEKQFENFMQAMYGDKNISENQEKDMGKAFYAGMLVCLEIFNSVEDDEEIAIAQLVTLQKQVYEKIKELGKIT